MEVYVYGKGKRGRMVEQHNTINRPKIWVDKTGFTILKAGNVEVNLTTQDIERLARCNQRNAEGAGAI